MIFSENRLPLFRIMLSRWSMIFSENRFPLFRIMLCRWSMIFSENRLPLFRIMLCPKSSGSKWLPDPQPREKRGGKRQRESLVWCRMGGPSEAEACIPCQHVKTRAFRASLRP
jgi:hypothetical protein